jgi:hypothetical protein
MLKYPLSHLRRLNLRSRSQVAVWAVEQGLYRSSGEDCGE